MIVIMVTSLSVVGYYQPPAQVHKVRETGLRVREDWRCFRNGGEYVVLGVVENIWPEPISHVLASVDLYRPDGLYWRNSSQSLGRFEGYDEGKVVYIVQRVPARVQIETCEIKLFDQQGYLLVEGEAMALVYDIDFEVGDYTEWETDNSGTDMNVVAHGLGGSTYSSEVFWNQDLTPEKVYNDMSLQTLGLAVWRIGCRIESNTLLFGGAANVFAFINLQGGGETFWLTDGGSGLYDINVRVPVAPGTGDGGGDFAALSYAGLTDATEYTIEMRNQRSSADLTSDGAVRLYVNGVLEAQNNAIDNYDEIATSSTANFEHVGGNIFGISDPGGSVYVDDIIFRDDDTQIFAPPTPTVSHIWLSEDKAVTWTNIGNSATWGANLIGGVVAKPLTSLQTIWAMVGATLYKTTNQGTSWSAVATVGYEADFLELLDGDVLFVANRASGGNRASLVDDATGTVTHINTGKTTSGGATDGSGVA